MVGEKCEINNFDVLTVADELLDKNIVDHRKAAMTTAGYVALWQCGQRFDFESSAVQKHRARLRQIGIDIKTPFDGTRHGIVFIRNVREIERVFQMPTPAFYRPAVVPNHARHLQLVAA